MTINVWLVLDIALGIVVGDLLKIMVKDTREWWYGRRAKGNAVGESKEAGDPDESDWQFLWDNAPESSKKEVQQFIEDDQLRLRAKEFNLWPHL
jgi:hypothetical protein